MELFEGSQPHFDGLSSLAIPSDHEQSDSEDEIGLSSLADHDTYSHMNIPESMKNILRMNPDGKDMDSTQEDSESDTDSMYKTPRINIEQLNADIAKNKFLNFPLMPANENEPETKKKTNKKSKEKKKRRDKGKQIEQHQPKTKNLDDLLAKFANEEESDQDMDKPKKKSKGRKTRKEDVSKEPIVDENGEKLIRTTEFLDTDSDETSDEERALSKRQELEMHKESERLRRTGKLRLKPVYNLKSFDELVKKYDTKETSLPNQTVQQQPQSPPPQQDDGLVILNSPINLASMMSPDRTKYSVSAWSPVKLAATALRSHNKSMLSRITNEGYAHRVKMEEEAKARGKFSSATERAKMLLEKEKNAMMINAQIKMHFERNKRNNEDEDEDEMDEDYQDEDDAVEDEDNAEEDAEEDDYLNQLSGQDEEEETDLSIKRKMVESSSEEEEVEDMATMAMKRWKNKKIKKSIFDESDDEEEEEEEKAEQKKKMVPAHSIANFFKEKEAEITNNEEPVEENQLGRLKRRVIEQDSDSQDDMDIDEPITNKEKPRHIVSGPQEKNDYLEEEAEEEEDEFFGAGGEDIDNGENLDEFEEDGLLVHENNEHIDEAALRDVFNKQDAESDNNMIQRLLTDVTGGGLRKQKAAAEAGLVLDDIDLYDEEDNDLIAVRLAAAARRRKMLKKKGGDPLENLMSDPKTSAFAKAAQAIPEGAVTAFLSDISGDEEEEEEQVVTEKTHTKLIITEEEDEEEDKDDLMDVFSDEDNLVVDEFNPMASPLRVGLVNNMIITSADDDDEEFQVENMQNVLSPLNQRRTKSMFNSPVTLNRFKRLMSETNNHSSDSPRAGFGSTVGTNKSEEKKSSTLGSIGGFLKNGNNEPKKSKLGTLLKKQNVFTYVD